MARAREQKNGRLEEAMALLIPNQAAFLSRMAEIDARVAEINRINSERLSRIETLLFEYNRILQALPEAVREKIGFKGP